MNKVILMGRLVKDPILTYSKQDTSMAICKYTLAVDRRMKKEDAEQTADFFNCVAFGKAAEFAEKYFHKGQRIMIDGRLQTGSYTNKEGHKVYTTTVIIENQEFADSKKESTDQTNNTQQNDQSTNTDESVLDGFMAMTEGIEDELPFN